MHAQSCIHLFYGCWVQTYRFPSVHYYALAGPVQIAQLLVIGYPFYYCLCLILLQVLNFYLVGVEYHLL